MTLNQIAEAKFTWLLSNDVMTDIQIIFVDDYMELKKVGEEEQLFTILSRGFSLKKSSSTSSSPRPLLIEYQEFWETVGYGGKTLKPGGFLRALTSSLRTWRVNKILFMLAHVK